MTTIASSPSAAAAPARLSCTGCVSKRPVSPTTADESVKRQCTQMEAKPFNHLPVEVRLMIWESTWPEPRVIDITQLSDFLKKIRCEAMRLHPISSFSTWLESKPSSSYFIAYGHYFEDFDFPRLEERQVPVALHICSESRAHTKKTFVFMDNSNDSKDSCYLNTRDDILWIRPTDDKRDDLTFDRLKLSYGSQLESITSIVITFTHFLRNDLLAQMALLPGLSLVLIVFEPDEDLWWLDKKQAKVEIEAMLKEERERSLTFQLLLEDDTILDEFKSEDYLPEMRDRLPC
ncbi:hypothetical protein ACJZ2D_005274 [Fusarium nematophilum]